MLKTTSNVGAHTTLHTVTPPAPQLEVLAIPKISRTKRTTFCLKSDHTQA